MLYSVTELQMIRRQWWSNADRENSRYTEMNLRYCRFVHHKSRMHWPEIAPGTPLWHTDD
jgi:hypothetical protein